MKIEYSLACNPANVSSSKRSQADAIKKKRMGNGSGGRGKNKESNNTKTGSAGRSTVKSIEQDVNEKDVNSSYEKIFKEIIPEVIAKTNTLGVNMAEMEDLYKRKGFYHAVNPLCRSTNFPYLSIAQLKHALVDEATSEDDPQLESLSSNGEIYRALNMLQNNNLETGALSALMETQEAQINERLVHLDSWFSPGRKLVKEQLETWNLGLEEKLTLKKLYQDELDKSINNCSDIQERVVNTIRELEDLLEGIDAETSHLIDKEIVHLKTALHDIILSYNDWVHNQNIKLSTKPESANSYYRINIEPQKKHEQKREKNKPEAQSRLTTFLNNGFIKIIGLIKPGSKAVHAGKNCSALDTEILVRTEALCHPLYAKEACLFYQKLAHLHKDMEALKEETKLLGRNDLAFRSLRDEIIKIEERICKLLVADADLEKIQLNERMRIISSGETEKKLLTEGYLVGALYIKNYMNFFKV